MKPVLVVGCGFPQLGLIHVARELGLTVVGADRDPWAVGVPHCDVFVQASTGEPERLEAVARTQGVGAVATAGSEVGLRSAAEVAARLGLPFWVTPEAAVRATDKAAMRAACAAAGVVGPRVAECPDLPTARGFAEAVGYPLVVKPVAGWGQRGVSRLDGPPELEAAFAAAAEVGAARVLLEAWLPGREYSVNGWLDAGRFEALCVTERLVFPGRAPLGVMRAEVHPDELSPSSRAAVVEVVARSAAALGLDAGPCYAQVRHAPGEGARLVEISPRTGGGFDPEVTRLASGVDLYRRLLGVVCGVPEWRDAGPTHVARPAAVVEFASSPAGRLSQTTGLARARGLPGVEAVHVFVRPGEQVRPLENGACRPGCAVAWGSDRAEAESRARAALDAVCLELEPA